MLRFSYIGCWTSSVVMALSIFFGVHQSAAAQDSHPLDGLGGHEIQTVVSLLASEGLVDEASRFPYIGLVSPPKEEVLAQYRVSPPDRRAMAVIRQRGQTHEVIVNLTNREIEAWRDIPGVQTNILGEEWRQANSLLRADPNWQSAMNRRGFTDYDAIYCATLTVGYFGDGEDRRLVSMPCYDISAGGPNIYARPIEGLNALVNLDSAEIISLIDGALVPVSTQTYDWSGANQTSTVQSTVNQNIQLADNVVRWRNWSFHLRIDRRVGPVLSLVRFHDRETARSVLYQGSLSELAVPYMSEREGWYFRSYMDIGEYGFGNASRLVVGSDCPDNAQMFAAVFANDRGQPYTARDAACLFVRQSAQPAWRHVEAFNGSQAISVGEELVLRFIPTVGNYDYIIDWVLVPSGEIRIEVGATGILAARGIDSADGLSEDGELIAPDLVGVNHDHFFSFRLDFDVDGPVNRVQVDRIALSNASVDQSPRRVWRSVSEPVAIESALEAGHNLIGWRITNPQRINDLGQPSGYQVVASHSATSILPDSEWTLARSAFATAPMWVTRYAPDQLYAAGQFPNQSRPGEGLPEFVNGEKVEDADVVLWPTLGFHHIPRPEEWPVMPTMTKRIVLRPQGFVEHNVQIPPAGTE